MTEVKLTMFKWGMRLDCKGHATGNQDVCTAVSTMVCALDNYARWKGLTIRKAKLDPGDAEIEIENFDEMGTLFDFYAMTFLGIAEGNIKYINVKIQNRK